MATDVKYGLMGLNIRESMRTVYVVVLGSLRLRTGIDIVENLRRMTITAMAA